MRVPSAPGFTPGSRSSTGRTCSTVSTDYYDRNAASFFADTVAADMSAARKRFLAHMPPGGRILDAGCGSGRDARAFSEVGYAVEAFDASPAMVRLASKFTGLPVRCMTFDDMSWAERFDGIWASASLLHVPRADLPRVAEVFRRALKPGGVWYISFKHGTEEREKDGRRFTDMTDQTLQAVLSTIPGLCAIEVWISEDVR